MLVFTMEYIYSYVSIQNIFFSIENRDSCGKRYPLFVMNAINESNLTSIKQISIFVYKLLYSSYLWLGLVCYE